MAAGDLLSSVQNGVFIPEIIANQVLGRLPAYLFLGSRVAKDSELVAQQVGTTIDIPLRGTIVANNLAENGSVVLQQPAATKTQVVLNQHQEVTIGELDYIKAVQQMVEGEPGTQLPGYVEDAVLALAENIETLLAQLQSSVPTQLDAGGTAVNDLIAVRKAMVDQKTPRLAKKFGYVSTGFMQKMLKEMVQVNPFAAQTVNTLNEGTIASVVGFEIGEGQLVERDGSPGVDRNLFFTRNGLVLATRPMPLPEDGLGAKGANVIDENGIALQFIKSYNAARLGTQFTLHVLYGGGLYDKRQTVELDSTY